MDLSGPQPKVRVRTLDFGDQEGVIACLSRHFPERSDAYWRAGWSQLATREVPDGCPRFGHCLDAGGAIVGVLLVIHSARGEGGDTLLTANNSSWCVDVTHRMFAGGLALGAMRRKDVVYTNVSAAPHTLRSLPALGYQAINSGQFLFAPLLAPRRGGARAQSFDEGSAAAARLPAWERRLLADHAALGCFSCVVETDSRVYGFVTINERILRGRIPCAEVIYGGSGEALALCAGSIGRDVLRLRQGLLLVDSNGPVPGLLGRYIVGRNLKFFKGPRTPNLGDNAYSELVYLGRGNAAPYSQSPTTARPKASAPSA